MMLFEYLKDKHGNELRYIRGYRIRDDKGELFEQRGTGLDLDMGVTLWTKDNKPVWRNPSEVELLSEWSLIDPMILMAAAVVIVVGFIAAFLGMIS